MPYTADATMKETTDLIAPYIDRLDEALADQTAGWYSVLEYGALGNGVADDTAAIQAAITAAGSQKVVYLPPGTYLYTTLTLNSSIRFLGAGYGATFLKQSANGDGLQLNVGGGAVVNNIVIENLTLGATVDRTSGAAIRLGYVAFVNVRNVRITSVLGGRPWEGLRLDRASDTHFSNVRVQGCASHGAVLAPGSASSVIVEVYFDGECEFRSGLADGMLMQMDYAYSENVCSLEGIHVAATFYNNLTAARIKPTITGASPRNIHFNAATFDSNSGNSQATGSLDGGVIAEATVAGTSIRRLHICLAGAWSSFNTNIGIALNGVKDFTICCGEVRSNGRVGIDIQNCQYGTVQVPGIHDNSRLTNDTSYGLQIGGSSQYIVVASTLNNTDAQTNDQRGVNIGSSAADLDLTQLAAYNQVTTTVPVINHSPSGAARVKLPRGAISSVQTGAYSVPTNIDVVRCDTTAAGFTVTLPRADAYPDREIVVKRTAGANTVTIAATAGTVETTSVTTTPVRHRSDGSNWIAI